MGRFDDHGHSLHVQLINQQIRDVQAKRGTGDLAKLLRGGDTWRVEAR